MVFQFFVGERVQLLLRFATVAPGLVAELKAARVAAMDSAASAQATRLERFAAHLNLLRVHSYSSIFAGRRYCTLVQ
jgi:hypothetical protein